MLDSRRKMGRSVVRTDARAYFVGPQGGRSQTLLSARPSRRPNCPVRDRHRSRSLTTPQSVLSCQLAAKQRHPSYTSLPRRRRASTVNHPKAETRTHLRENRPRFHAVPAVTITRLPEPEQKPPTAAPRMARSNTTRTRPCRRRGARPSAVAYFEIVALTSATTAPPLPTFALVPEHSLRSSTP